MESFFTSVPGIISILGLLGLFVIRYLPQMNTKAIQATDVKLIMQILVTVVMLVAGLYIILSNTYPEDTKKWAFGSVGLVIGFWLPV